MEASQENAIVVASGIAMLVISFSLDKYAFVLFSVNPILTNIANILSNTIVISVAAVIAVLAGKSNLKKAIPVVAIAALIGIILKVVLGRLPPSEEVTYFLGIPDYSFPSNHTLIVFALIPFIRNNSVKISWAVITVLIAISRIYLREHYVSDVVAGAMIGYVIGWIGLKVINNQTR